MNIVCIQSPNYDLLTASLIQGLSELGHSICSSENSNYQTASSTLLLRRKALNADLIIVFSNTRVRLGLLDRIPNPNIVFVDGSDSQYFSVPNGIRFKAVFKRELNRYWRGPDSEAIFPLPFAAEERYFRNPTTVKSIDLSYVATMHTAFRQSVENFLKARRQPTWTIGTLPYTTSELNVRLKGLPKESSIYRDVLHRSKMSVNVIGGGYDCGRYWEILAANAVLISQKLDILIPNELIDRKHCLYFSSLEELGECIDWLLSSPYRIEEIRQNAYKHLLCYHTCVARAEYFLEKIALLNENLFCDSFFTPRNQITFREKLMKGAKFIHDCIS
jgi:hypothetical protein